MRRASNVDMHRVIKGDTAVFGILGHPVSHSLSPVMHNAAFIERKINAIYVPFDIQKPGVWLKKSILEMGIRGLSVTIPHKSWAAKAADEKDKLSILCGAANTIIPIKNKLHAFNTDGPGALQALRHSGCILKRKRILLIGYGGSAAAVAHSLLLEGDPETLFISGRNKNKIKIFTQALKAGHRKSSSGILAWNSDMQTEKIDIIINTTPLGMTGHESALPLPESLVAGHQTVFDIVYTPMYTPLLKLAASRGAKTVSGYLMLLFQAALQFEKFTGAKAPVSLMEKELLAELRKRT